MFRARGPVIGFDVIDRESFVRSVFSMPWALHLAAAGPETPDVWPAELQQVVEPPRIDHLEAREAAIGVIAFVVNNSSRDALIELLTWDDPYTAVWNIWHWWLRDDQELLVSAYDWDSADRAIAHPSIESYLLELEKSGVIRIVERFTLEDEWFDEQKRRFEEWTNQ